MKQYKFEARGGSYGVFISIVADNMHSDKCDNYEWITEDLAVKWAPGNVIKGERICAEDKESIIQAIKLISVDRVTVNRVGSVICIYSIQYSLCDFQQEGLIVAMMHWCEENMGAKIGNNEFVFDKDLHRYKLIHNGVPFIS